MGLADTFLQRGWMVKRPKQQTAKPLKTKNLPARFTPQFWKEADCRLAVVKEIRRRVDRLKRDVASDSYQKDILCERAIFIACQLETQERIAIERGTFDPGRYTQMVNAMVGLLRSLGLERRARRIEDLQSYVAKQGKKRRRA